MPAGQPMIVEFAVAQLLHYSTHGIFDMNLGMGMEQGIVDVKDVKTALLGSLG
jgi:hypothetical protein